MRVRFDEPPASFSCFAVDAECAVQHGCRAKRGYYDRDRQSSTITVGGTVGLTATVQPNTVSITPGKAFTKPTGTITFLDGSTLLNGTPAALLPNTFANASFQQTFGTLGPTIAQSVSGQLTGDLNGDGVADMLVYGWDPVHYQTLVQTFISNGRGGYTTGAVQSFAFVLPVDNYAIVDSLPTLIDLNGDGKLDLLYGIQVAYGNGDGTFAAEVPVSFLSTGFLATYAADLNGDGKTDILAVDNDDGQFSVTPFINSGGGSFTSSGTVPIGSLASGFFDLSISAPNFVDLTGDGKLDVIWQWESLGDTPDTMYPIFSVLLNNGNGTFGIPTQFNTSPNFLWDSLGYTTGSADVNGDGKQDYILATEDTEGRPAVITLLGNGDGTFQNPIYTRLPSGVNTDVNFIIQDVNLDGKPDLVFANGLLALGNGDGTFSLGSPLFPIPGFPYYLYLLGQIDLVGSPVPSLVFLNQYPPQPPAAVFTPQTSSSTVLSLGTLAVGTHSITARYSAMQTTPLIPPQRLPLR